MGLIHANLQLLNPTHPEVQGLAVNAVAGSGAVHLCIPEQMVAGKAFPTWDQWRCASPIAAASPAPW